MRYTYIFLVRVTCDMVDVRRVLNEIGPPRSKFWVLYLVVLELELKVGIKSNELRIHPSEPTQSWFADLRMETLMCWHPR